MAEKTKKKKLSGPTEASLDTLRLLDEPERVRIMVSPGFIRNIKKWPESDLFLLYDEVIGERYPLNNFHQNLLMLCEEVMKAGLFRSDMPTEVSEYLIDRLTALVKAFSNPDEPELHPRDILNTVKWVYQLCPESNQGKVGKLARLCGAQLDVMWVDNFCRRHIDTSVWWQRQFRSLLANGMIEGGLGDENFWDAWNISSGCYLDQSDPEHYSREKLLMDRLNTLKTRGMIAYVDGLQLARIWIEELTGLIGGNRTIDFLHLNGWPSDLDPK